MGGAILGGLIKAQDAFESIRVTCATAASARALAERGVEVRNLEDDAGANQWALDEADIIILGVKPHYLLGLLREVAPHAPESAVMVSIAAGITVEHMEQLWAGALIRTMPNTPSQVGKGVTGLSAGSQVTEDQLKAVTRVFETVGSVLQVDESSLNALSTFSGSGPAFVYFFIERFMEVALEHGFTPEQATTMVQGTFAGAMELLEHSGKTPQELREAVTSPGGTTQAALEVYRAADLGAIIREASAAAIARAEEMAKG
jgi:pyrroline-5-carboxylate reductase